MALFESYERRIDKINGVLAQYGIKSVEECREICKAKGFDPYEFFDKKEARKLDTFTQYGMVVVDEAIRDAGLDQEAINPDRVGVIFATGMGGVESFQSEIISFANGNLNPRFSPFFITKTIGDICAGQISIKYGFRGPNYSTSAACASAPMAISDAFMYLRLGKADVMISGGSEACRCGVRRSMRNRRLLLHASTLHS